MILKILIILEIPKRVIHVQVERMSKVVVKSIKQIDFSNLNRAIFKIATPTMFGFLGLILFEIVDIFQVDTGDGRNEGGCAGGKDELVVFQLLRFACFRGHRNAFVVAINGGGFGLVHHMHILHVAEEYAVAYGADGSGHQFLLILHHARNVVG